MLQHLDRGLSEGQVRTGAASAVDDHSNRDRVEASVAEDHLNHDREEKASVVEAHGYGAEANVVEGDGEGAAVAARDDQSRVNARF